MLTPDTLITPLIQALPDWLPHTEWHDWVIVMLSPLFLLAVGLEWWHYRRQDRQATHPIYAWADAWASIGLGGVYLVLDVFIVAGLVLPAMQALYTWRLTTIAITPWSLLALWLGVEFCYYWFHRASHRVRWFWCAHVVHHGSEHMNFTTAMRQSWLYSFAGNWLFYLPMVLIGYDPVWVMVVLSLNLGYQFFIHTQWVTKLPRPIEYLFNTPSHHRAHHGRNPQYIDRNYGGTLIVFDRLFGTFVEEVERPDYGIVRQVKSYNLLWLTLHEWVDMIRDILRPGPLALRLKHLWAPPEWDRTQDNPGYASERPTRPHHTARP
ncbi:sterol desaturase family protein [Aquabacterium sp.]|uniref:sterol desaturase family protein n=1 Tax=Aquabacterium sp. TaxID=1872578 RepID=UPI0035B15CFA